MSARISLLAPMLLAALGCGSSTTGAACQVEDQTDCVDSALGYDDGIGELLEERCSPCHASGGVERTSLLTDYEHVSRQRMSIANQLVTCSMPPAGSPALSGEERERILAWLSCGGPK